jgi:hypothetical protein
MSVAMMRTVKCLSISALSKGARMGPITLEHFKMRCSSPKGNIASAGGIDCTYHVGPCQLSWSRISMASLMS